MTGFHTFLDDDGPSYPIGKIVCIGKNYRSSAEELPVKLEDPPVLFMKPSCALVPIEKPIKLPSYSTCYYEIELAVLIGKSLQNASSDMVHEGIAGYAIALDLTLKELLDTLKEQSRAWELAKAFDNSCPISPFITPEKLNNPQDTQLRLTINGEIRQEASTLLMIGSVLELVSCISKYFTLEPGDVVLTGTPAGGDKLNSKDQIVAELDNTYRYETSII